MACLNYDSIFNMKEVKILLDYSDDDLCDGLDSTVFMEDNQNSCVISPHVSYARRSKSAGRNATRTDSLSFDDTVKCLSFENMEVSDADFLDSDARKQIILGESNAAFSPEMDSNLQNKNPDSTGCSSWKPCTQKKKSDISSLDSDESQCISISHYIAARSDPLTFLSVDSRGIQNKNPDSTGCSSWKPCTQKKSDISSLDSDESQCISISHYIPARSDPLTVLSVDSTGIQPSFCCEASTPVQKRKSLFSLTLDAKLDDCHDFSKLNYFKNEVSTTFSGEKPSSPLLPLYSVNTKMMENRQYNFHFYIGNTNYKNIQRLKAEEYRRTMDWNEGSFVSESGFSNTYGIHAATTLQLPFEEKENSIVELWNLQPREVTVEPNKGCRVLLINNSNKKLKFKAKFDGKITNVCPLSGTLPAKGQIGLRIQASNYIKKLNENIEDDVKIIIGKLEQKVHVKLINEQKPKSSIGRICKVY